MLTRAEYNLYRFAPTAEDIARARDDIAEHEGAIASLDAEISALFARIRRIEEQKKRHAIAIAKSKGVLTLARRTPEEVLARIFELCVADGWTRAPIVVSQVCSAWRNAARAPKVWSHIYVDSDKGDPRARCALWLSRARQSLLDITLRTGEHASLVDAVMDILLEHIGRWRSFTLEVPSVASANYVLTRCTKPAACLKEVFVHMANGSATAFALANAAAGDEARVIRLNEAFGELDAPNLARLSLTSDETRSWVGMEQITSLELRLNLYQSSMTEHIDASDILQVLANSPRLQQCSIVIPRLETRHLRLPPPTEQYSLPNLTSLSLNLPSPVVTMLSYLDTPALRDLRLRTPEDPHGFASQATREAIRTFFSVSNPPLRFLEFYDIDISQQDFLFCLNRLDDLEEIRLHGSEILDDTIAALSPPSLMCPNLKRLDLRWCGHLTGSAIAKLVRSRSSMGEHDVVSRSSAIEELTVINCSFVNEHDILEIAKYTVCSLKMRDEDDYCLRRGCCDNVRYRLRFKLRHTNDLTPLQLARIRL